MIDFLKNIPKSYFLIAVIVILLVAIPVTMYLVRQQQITRSRATGESVSFRLEPATATHAVNEVFSVDLMYNSGLSDVSAVDINATTGNNLQVVDFTPVTTFTRVLRSISPGNFRFVGVDQTNNLKRGDVKVGTLRMKLLAGAVASPGQFNFDDANTKVTISSLSTVLSSTANTNGQYSLPGGSTSCIYFGTEVRLKGSTDPDTQTSWVRHKAIRLSQTVTVSAFHQTEQGNPSSFGFRNNPTTPAGNVIITVHKPNNEEVDILNGNGSVKQVDWKPDAGVGTYRFTAVTRGMDAGAGCIDGQ